MAVWNRVYRYKMNPGQVVPESTCPESTRLGQIVPYIKYPPLYKIPPLVGVSLGL